MKQIQHLGVYGVILKGDELLLIKKARGPYTGRWDLPGGRLEHGESLSVGLVREVLEETGVLVKEADPYLNLSHTEKYAQDGEDISLHHIGLVYFVGEYNAAGFISRADQDAAESAWVALETIKEENASPFLWRVVQSILG